jgi:glycosyltransferase involved in cell wall biosynthesis
VGSLREETKEEVKVSVIMSVFNGEKHLREAIESILNQTFSDFEFIIINDGSTDRTQDIAEGFRQLDNRIRLINQSNMGLTKSLNKAIRLARGEFIARMDADDIALPERFEKQVDFLEKHSDVALLGTAYYEIDEKGEVIGEKIFPERDEEIRKIILKCNPFFHASVMVRREVFEIVGLYDESIPFAQDYDFWLRIAGKYKVANLPEPLMKRRYTPVNISIAQENEQLKWALEVRKRALRRGDYPWWQWLYLVRPAIVLLIPSPLRNFIRKHFLKSGRVIKAVEKNQ